MLYNGVSFNEDWAKTKTVEEFVAHESHHDLSEKQLKEAYYLMNPKVKKPEEAKKLVEKPLGSE
jgi:hypothetical protein